MRGIDGRRHLPSVLLAVFSLAMVAPLVFAGKVFLFRDFGYYYFPVKRYFVNRVLEGGFPLWSPEMSCGTPVHGELLHGFLYPPNVFLFLGAAPGWGLYFAAHLLLAGLGARRLAMKFGAGADAALAAGVAFAGSGYLVSQMNHVPYASAAAWAPLIVSLIMDLGDRRPSTVPLLSVCFAMAALAGEPFTVLLTVLFGGVVVLAGFAGPRLPAILKTGIAGAIALLIASPSLLPAFQQLGESARAGTWEPEADGFGSLHPVRFVTVFAPEGMGRLQHAMELPVRFFGSEFGIRMPILLGIHLGALTLVAVFMAPLRTKRAARWLLAVIVVAGLLSLGPHLGLATWLSRTVPGLAFFRYPDKYWFVVTLAAAPLLGVAISVMRPRPSTIVAGLCAVAALVLGLGTGQTVGAVTGALSFGLVAVAFRAPPEWRTRALTAVLALELLFFGLRHGEVTDPANLSPMHPDGIGAELRKERPGRIFDDYFWPIEEQDSALMIHRLRHMQALAGLPDGFHYTIGYDPVEPVDRIARFFLMPEDLPVAEAIQVWHRLLRLSATTHTFTNTPMREDRDVALPRHLQRPPWVWALTYLRPAARARLYGGVVYAPDLEAGKRLIQNLSFDPFTTLVLEGAGKPSPGDPPRGGVRFIENHPHRVRLKVESDRPAWLLLADTFAPGWTATVDGEPAEIHVGLVAFRVVRVPEGESEVEFRYEPGWLRVVPFTAGAGLLLLGLVFWWGRRMREK